MKGALRFLNTDTQQVRRRANTKSQRARRQKLAKTKRVMLQSGQARQRAGLRQHRPCCGRHSQNCTCKAPKGMNKKPLTALIKRFTETDLCTVADTTDVGPWQEIMQDRCKNLPMRAILGYSQIHVTFNQEHLLKQFVEDKAFLFKKPWVDWERLAQIVAQAKKHGMVVRSSNYYSTTLKKVLLQSGLKPAKMPTDPVSRDVLACQIVDAALPRACCDLYDARPSRDHWQAMLEEWLQQIRSKCRGPFSHYYLKCCLDRLFAVKRIDHGTISWWPVTCPAYDEWYKLLYPNRTLSRQEKFQTLCITYAVLNRKKHCTFTDALAQTCWVHKERNGRLRLTSQ